MAYAADTGNGTTISLSTTASIATFQFNEIGLGEEALEALDDSHLGTTTYMTKLPADLADPGIITGTLQLDTGTAQPSLGTVETATITLPLRSGQSTNATLVATGFISNWVRTNVQNNQIMTVQMTFTMDGKTGPTFTAGS